MLFSDIAPFVRFAEIIHYESEGKPVFVRDCRIFYILSGEATLRIDDGVYTLRPHTVFYCSNAQTYTISSPYIRLMSINFDLNQQNSLRELPFSPVRVEADKALPPTHRCFIEDQPALNRHIFLENGTGCRELLEAILAEFSTRRILYPEIVSALTKALLVQLLRGSVETASQSAKAVAKIMDHIHSHYNEPMSNKQLSKLTGYHEYYLNRLFTKHTGKPIRQYILDVRIRHARALLLNSDYPLSIIAEKVGFNSNTYFSSYFRQLTGLSPAQFRKKYKNAL